MIRSEELIKKWQPLLEHPDLEKISDPHKRATVAQLLENQEIAIKEELQGSGGYGSPSFLGEAAPTNNIGSNEIKTFDPVLISLIRRTMPNLIAYDICGVQPMTGPTGLIFAMRPRYESQTGTEAFFDEAKTEFSASANNASGGPNIANTQLSDTGWDADGTQVGTDPGDGQTWAPDAAKYSVSGGAKTADMETFGDGAGNHYSEMGFSIEKVTVTARSRALKAEYTMELAQDLKAVHGLDAETELSNILSAEILAEINREVVRTINITATKGAAENTQTAGVFNLDVDANGRWSVERFKGLIFQLEREANAIAKATRRGKGNILITSSDVASALNMAGVLDYTPALNNNLQVDDTGNTFAGVMNGRIKVYVDPYFSSSTGQHFATMGYKGSNPFDAGMFYCPYVPLQMVRAIGENTFQPKIGFKTRYGMVANPFALTNGPDANNIQKDLFNSYYRRIVVTNLM